MVKLHIKRGDESVFLFETTAGVPVQDLISQLVKIFNGVLKVQRLCQGAVAMLHYDVDLDRARAELISMYLVHDPLFSPFTFDPGSTGKNNTSLIFANALPSPNPWPML